MDLSRLARSLPFNVFLGYLVSTNVVPGLDELNSFIWLAQTSLGVWPLIPELDLTYLVA